MTEADWLACTNPDPMLAFLSTHGSDRKLRLFACACARRHWDFLPDESCRHAVEVSEQYADDQATKADLERAWLAASRMAEAAVKRLSRWDMVAAAEAEARDAARGGAWTAAHSVTADMATAAERQAECELLREIFGNPFQPPALDPARLTPEVRSLARDIYQQRSFDRLPSLADALARANCADAELVNHCRQAEGHVRGCWALDLVLGIG
jgi:hypothetical protein